MAVITCKLGNYKPLHNNNVSKEPIKIKGFSVQFPDQAITTDRVIKVLPGYAKEITKLFSEVIAQHASQIKQKEVNSVRLREENGQLHYELLKDQQPIGPANKIRDEEIPKRYKRLTGEIQTFFKDISQPIGSNEFSDTDLKIMKYGIPSRLSRLNKDLFKTNDTEWPLWTLFVLKFKNTVEGILEIVGLKSLIDWIPEGVNNIIGGGLSLQGFLEGITLTKEAKEIGDEEGVFLGVHQIDRNLAAFFACSLDWVRDFCVKALAMTTAVVALPILVPVLFLGVMGDLIYKHYYMSNEISKLKKEMIGLLGNKNLTLKQIKTGLKSLEYKIRLSHSREVGKILGEIKQKNPGSSKEQIMEKLNKELTNKVLTRGRRFERRTGISISDLESIQNDIDQILRHPDDKENISKTYRIFERIKEGIELKKAENKWSAVSVAFQILGIVFYVINLPVFALASGVIASVIALILLSYKLIVNKIAGSSDVIDSQRSAIANEVAFGN